ncbi:MAG: hypothetical protein JOZ03_00070 [Gammaproteobacteria bacterium]|nr:hypothetical protein [Gammaproteobacteria bacterium]
MRRLVPVVFLIVVLLAPLPPFFTNGACTAEFEQASSTFQQMRGEMRTLSAATDYLTAHHMPYATVTQERCEQAPPRDVEYCPGGPILVLSVPVRNVVCRYYRDATIRQQFGFNGHQQLVHLQTDMNPFRFRKLPFLDIELDWGK